jgi:pilus assembly protein CpaD
MTRSIYRHILAGSLLVTFLPGLGACTGSHEGPGTVRVAPVSHQTTVFRETRTHAVSFAPGRTDLTGGERTRLAEAVAKAGAAEVLHVRLPLAGGTTARLEADARRQTIITALETLGIPARRVELENQPSADSALLVVSLDRYVAVPPAACPDWSDAMGSADSRQIASNWGCATATNLGLMVADPYDLFVGRQTSPASGEHASNAAARYRTDKVYPPVTSGTGSLESNSQ